MGKKKGKKGPSGKEEPQTSQQSAGQSTSQQQAVQQQRQAEPQQRQAEPRQRQAEYVSSQEKGDGPRMGRGPGAPQGQPGGTPSQPVARETAQQPQPAWRQQGSPPQAGAPSQSDQQSGYQQQMPRDGGGRRKGRGQSDGREGGRGGGQDGGRGGGQGGGRGDGRGGGRGGGQGGGRGGGQGGGREGGQGGGRGGGQGGGRGGSQDGGGGGAQGGGRGWGQRGGRGGGQGGERGDSQGRKTPSRTDEGFPQVGQAPPGFVQQGGPAPQVQPAQVGGPPAWGQRQQVSPQYEQRGPMPQQGLPREQYPQTPQQGSPQRGPPPQQMLPAGQPAPWGQRQPPQGLASPPAQQSPVHMTAPSTPTSPAGFEQTGAQKKKPQQHRGPKQQQQQREERAGPSQPSPPTTEMAKMKISGRVEAGQGDQPDILPMEYVKATPGVQGRKIVVETNHITLNVGKLKTAIHYDVNLVPDTPKKFLRTVVEMFRQKHFPNRYPAFDGRKNLYSAGPLPFNDIIEDEITIPDSGGREKKYKVAIKFANEVDLTPLQNLMLSKATPREAMQVVDIVLRSAPAMTCISVGRSFFLKPQGPILDLGEGMEMYNGFYQSAIRGWKPFLNVDVAHKAFPKSINLLDILPELLGSYYQPFTRDDLNKPLSNYQKPTLSKFIKQLRVTYEIPGQSSSKRVYRVNDIGEPPISKRFKLDSGEEITIDKYFQRDKRYKLRYPHLPSLWVGDKNRENKILLPLELCTLVEGQVLMRKMTEGQTSAMIKFAATSTGVRKNKIMTALNEANHNAHPAVKEFGFSVGNSLERLEARVLQPPMLMYAQNRQVMPSKGVWRGDRFADGVKINKWTIACVDRRPPRPDDLSKFAEMISRNATQCGMTISNPPEKPFVHISGSQSLQDIKKFFITQKEKGYDVIFVVVPNSGPQYSYVKTAAEINVGCLTQCIKIRTMNKMNPQTAINILLKVNSKLNGTNHYLGTRPPIMNKPCIIMGADVTHPSPDAQNIPSVAAVTASHDPKAFQYNICWRLQPPKVEIIEDLEAIVIEQLKYFFIKNRVKPERIIFFRDGVSEGQFEQVRNAEIRAIRSACKKLQQEGYEPSITFLVVQKRHHTRLFPTNPKDSEDRNNNVPAGTCVDHYITHPFMQDFYLVSHASIQGVAKPTKYCTLWDDNNLSNDDVEALTYYLCHMFTRCNRSVSYPAPTYYAHLAAARAKVYIENEQLNMDQLQREYARFKIQDVIRRDLPMFFV